MTKKKTSDIIIIVIIATFLLLPLLVAAIYSISVSWDGILPKGLTLEHYKAIFSDARFVKALFRTVLVSIPPIAITTGVMLLALFAVVVHFPKLEKYLQFLCMIPYALQGIILSVSVLNMYSGTGGILGQRIVMLSGAYCILILPYIYQGIRNGLYSVNAHTLLEAASVLGASQVYAYFRVIVPNIVSGITVSCLLAMSIIVGDFVLVNTIAGSSLENAQMYLYKIMSYSSGQSSAVFIVIFIVILLITASVLILQSKGGHGTQPSKSSKRK